MIERERRRGEREKVSEKDLRRKFYNLKFTSQYRLIFLTFDNQRLYNEREYPGD